MTNKEWAIKCLSTFLYDVANTCYHCGQDNLFNKNPCCPFGTCRNASEDVETWLKKERKNHLLEKGHDDLVDYIL